MNMTNLSSRHVVQHMWVAVAAVLILVMGAMSVRGAEEKVRLGVRMEGVAATARGGTIFECDRADLERNRGWDPTVSELPMPLASLIVKARERLVMEPGDKVRDYGVMIVRDEVMVGPRPWYVVVIFNMMPSPRRSEWGQALPVVLLPDGSVVHERREQPAREGKE